MFDERFGRTRTGSTDLVSIIGTQNIFKYPKPIKLLKFIVEISTNPTSTILDFFAGSGTTMHAMMELNAEDGGHRQCILVTNNENNICEEVTYERNRRVIQGYTTPRGETVEGLSSNTLRYYKTSLVPRANKVGNMRRLTAAATNLLCIRNDVYREVGEFGGSELPEQVGRYFDDGRTKMLVIYLETYVSYFVEKLLDMEIEGKILVYVFSNSNYAYDDEFEEVLDKVELCALPDAIYKAYKKVLPPERLASESAGKDGEEGIAAGEEDSL